MNKSDTIVSFVRTRGPTLPVHVAKHIGTNIIMASAMISDLVSKGKLRVSSIKVGGSPLYYAPGQESKLQKFADKLNPKDRSTMNKLKEEKVLREKELEPLERVSLRKIKDFAKPLKVRTDDGEEIFWKWYLLSDSEVEGIIEQRLKKAEVKDNPPEKPAEEYIETDKKDDIKEPEKEESKKQDEPEKKEFVDHTVSDEFLDIVKDYFKKKDIEIMEHEVVRKESDIDLVVRVPSAVGPLKFYCKAKSKKRSNHTDLASAVVQGQMKKLPAMYLTTGKVTKSAKEMLHKEFKGMVLKQIEWDQQ